MLSSWLLASLVCGAVATLMLFAPLPVGVGRVVGAWADSRRLLLAILGTLVVTAIGDGVLEAIGVTHRNLVATTVAAVAMSCFWLPATRRWSARAHVCWVFSVFLFVAYLAFMMEWTFESGMPAPSEAGGLVLWLLEAFAAFLACAYLWELCDALGSERWRRRVVNPVAAESTGEQVLPFVSFHVPAHNEPPDMVIDTLESLLRVDYPAYEICCIDDNTDDESLWRPVEQWCRAHGVKFEHLSDWPGYKSGALNYALQRMTDPRTELIAVCDSDYQIEPDFLKRTAPLFRNPQVGFIQAPQDYREWEHDRYYRRLYYSYSYFFAVSQPSRNERNGAIFAGTMGLIRRRALDELGGWDEWCITEDAELSLRLLRAGWSGLHVDASFGKGVMPLTFEALKGQRFRWCFGGIQILRMHWKSLLPGRRDSTNRLSVGQRWAYLSGALQWYGDLLGLLFFIFLLAGAVNIGLGGGLLFRKLSGFLLATIPLLFLLGLIRAVALLRRRTGASWREALGAFLIWQSTSLVTARASVQALFAKEAEFLRTPKTTEQSSLWETVRANRGETLLALAGLAGIGASLIHVKTYASPLTAVLLLWPTISYAAALVNSRAAQRAALPPDLATRRSSEWLRSSPARTATVAFGGLAAGGAVAALALALLAPSSGPVQSPNLIQPVQGQRPYRAAATAAHSSRSATPTASPSQTSTSPPGGSNSTSPIPSATPTPTSTTPVPTPSTTAPVPSSTASSTPTAAAS